MKKIVYKTETGIAVITPTRNGLTHFGIDNLILKDVPRIRDGELFNWNPKEMTFEEYKKYPLPEYKIIDESELPKDRVFRNAWGFDLKEDIPKAKEIWKEKLRVDRKPLFEANDIRFRDAYVINNTVELEASIAERDRLRDITKLVDSCKTISNIKKVKI